MQQTCRSENVQPPALRSGDGLHIPLDAKEMGEIVRAIRGFQQRHHLCREIGERREGMTTGRLRGKGVLLQRCR